MNPILRKLMLLVSALFVTAGLLSACGGGGDEDPDFNGPEWEGECPSPQAMKELLADAARQGFPAPPYEQYCPNEFAQMQALK